MTPRLIGVGVGRTGTRSIAAVCAQLDVRCYGMRTIARGIAGEELD